MSFFKDFKDDLSQAVNELIPEEEPVREDEPEMVDTLTEDVSSSTLESLLKGLDDKEQEEIPVPEENLEPEFAEEDLQLADFEEEPVLEESAPEEAAPEEFVLQEEEHFSADATDEMDELAEESLPEELPELNLEEVLPEEQPAEEAQAELPEELEQQPEETWAEEKAASEETQMDSLMEEFMQEETKEENEEEKVEMTMSKEQTMMSVDGPATDENSVITEGMTVNGDITSRGSMEVLGCIIGNIELKGKLNISGNIQGNSKAAEIFADSAKITGEVVSEGPVKVGQSSVIVGNITATSAVIAGAVKGNIDVQGPVILDTSAIVMGDIKSKSVQINNGAVIEGHCSQSYADVSPTSFFSEIKG